MGATASGAKGVVAFRQGAEKGYLPHESTLEYEGLYYDYMFATGSEAELFFAPKFSAAISKDPITGKREHWIAMGLNSKLDGAGLKKFGGRPNVNLIVVLDVSGSFEGPEHMDSTKLSVAKTSIVEALLPQLTANDKFSLVTFTEKAEVIMKLGEHHLTPECKQIISGITAEGGTTLAAGMRAACEVVASAVEANNKKSTRIFYFTDMCPNHEAEDTKAMLGMMQENAVKDVFTTFVGIGVDFNTSLVQQFASVKGCNWFSVMSPKAFKKLMNEDFAFIVTPAAFDVKVVIGPDAPFEAEAVYGSPGHSPNHDGVLCEVNSLFPSGKESEQLTKGGVVVVKLRVTDESKEQTLPLVTKYFDPQGNPVRFVSEVKFKSGEDYFEAVLLTRYVTFTKEYLRDGHAVNQHQTPTSSYVKTGLVNLAEAKTLEDVKRAYESHFQKLKAHYGTESDALQDKQLVKTWELLAGLFAVPATVAPVVAADADQ